MLYIFQVFWKFIRRPDWNLLFTEIVSSDIAFLCLFMREVVRDTSFLLSHIISVNLTYISSKDARYHNFGFGTIPTLNRYHRSGVLKIWSQSVCQSAANTFDVLFYSWCCYSINWIVGNFIFWLVVIELIGSCLLLAYFWFTYMLFWL